MRTAVRCGVLVFATAGQEAATSTLVLQEVDFVWKGEGSQVLLTGDFLGWDTKIVLVKGTDGTFHAKQKLSPGSYKYKYIVDGEWLHSPDSPMVADGKGGFNNEITVTDAPSSSANSPKSKPSSETGSSEVPTGGTKVSANADVARKPSAAPKAAPAAKPAKKVLDKPLPQMMTEDVIPKLNSTLAKEEDISNIDILFQENQLEGSFVKKGIIYTFWAFFPDGKLEGSRGFSLSSHGSPPSTVEPFLIDEKKVTADLLIFWITKRLFAQNLLSRN